MSTGAWSARRDWQDGKMARWPPPLVSWDSLPFRHAACLACSATPRYLAAYFAGHCTHPNLFNSPHPLLGGHHHSQHGTFFECHVTARWRAPGLSLIGELHVLEERSTFLLTIVSLGAFEEAPFTFPFLRILNICNTLDLYIVSKKGSRSTRQTNVYVFECLGFKELHVANCLGPWPTSASTWPSLDTSSSTCPNRSNCLEML